MLTNADVTIFNKHFNGTTKMDEYQRTYIYGVHWASSKAVNVIKSGMLEADSAVIQIPLAVASDSNKAHKTPKQWAATATADIHDYWTLQPGDKIVKGIIDYSIPSGTLALLEKTFDDVLTITSVDTIDYGSEMLRHYRVGGK